MTIKERLTVLFTMFTVEDMKNFMNDIIHKLGHEQFKYEKIDYATIINQTTKSLTMGWQIDAVRLPFETLIDILENVTDDEKLEHLIKEYETFIGINN